MRHSFLIASQLVIHYLMKIVIWTAIHVITEL